MVEVNLTVDESTINEETQLIPSEIKNTTAIPVSPEKNFSFKNNISTKELLDEELVRRFVETRAEDAFDEIVNRYADKIHRLALRITRNHSDAEDVLQEVLITLIEKLYLFREESKFSTWLYRVASNVIFMRLRAEKGYKSDISLEEYVSYNEDGRLKGVEIKDWSNRPDEMFLNKEVREIIEKAVNELPVIYRVVFHLRDVEGFTNCEVAKILDLSLATVKFRVHSVRLFLRKRLSDYFYELRK